jgi:hypothetical protein
MRHSILQGLRRRAFSAAGASAFSLLFLRLLALGFSASPTIWLIATRVYRWRWPVRRR